MSILFPGIRRIVFDFDCTITHIPTCFQLTFDEAINKGPNQYIETEIFRKFIEYLLRSGIDVAIASYGQKDVILAMMIQIFPEHSPFNMLNIITPLDVSVWEQIRWKECYNPPSGYNKNNMLDILAIKYGLRKNELLLIDDNYSNIINSTNAGYPVIIVPKCMGFYATLKQILLNFLPNENSVDLFIQAL